MLRPDTFALTALLALITALGPVSTDMYLPSLPDIGRLLAASAAEVQLTLSAYLVGFAGGQIVYGPFSDRYGRKPVLLVGLALFCGANLICAAAPSIEVLIAARALQALGGSGAIVVARAIVRDLYSGARAGRELSLMGSIMAVAPIAAPLIGGVLQTAFGWRANFIVALLVGLIAAVTVWRALPETLARRAAEPMSFRAIARAYAGLLANGAFVAHLGILAASFAGLFAWISGSPFVLQDLYGLSAFGYSIVFAICSVGFLAGTFAASAIVERLGLGPTIGLGSCALAAGGISMCAALALGATSVVAIVLPTTLYLFGLGLAMPQAMAGALTPFPHRAGAASSLAGFVMQSSAAILGAVVGHMLGDSAWPIAWPLAAMGLAALLVWTASRKARAGEWRIADSE
ncbi:MAG TPA: multidrug effflux MFS transporter [Xanthobacteraceae bacterium]|nr:multidrug effflux MFS transporter [Xanthobacteraceae bacterium]